MDEKTPHVLGSTRKMEAEFRAKREAETAAVQRRRAQDEGDDATTKSRGWFRDRVQEDRC